MEGIIPGKRHSSRLCPFSLGVKCKKYFMTTNNLRNYKFDKKILIYLYLLNHHQWSTEIILQASVIRKFKVTFIIKFLFVAFYKNSISSPVRIFDFCMLVLSLIFCYVKHLICKISERQHYFRNTHVFPFLKLTQIL